MRTSSIVWTLAIVLVLLSFGWYFWIQSTADTITQNSIALEHPLGSQYQGSTTQTDARASTSTLTTHASTTNTTSAQTLPMSIKVTYDGTVFTPATVTIAKGATVDFIDTAGKMWVASDKDPDHADYDGTTRADHCAPGATPSFDQCIPESTYSFTFTKTGSFMYHDHVNPSAAGLIVVK